jgi:hypothetical protein
MGVVKTERSVSMESASFDPGYLGCVLRKDALQIWDNSVPVGSCGGKTGEGGYPDIGGGLEASGTCRRDRATALRDEADDELGDEIEFIVIVILRLSACARFFPDVGHSLLDYSRR